MRAFCGKAPPPDRKGNLQRRRREGQRRSARRRCLQLEEERKRKRDRVVPDSSLAPRRSPTGRSTGRSRGSRRGSLQTPPFNAEGPDAPEVAARLRDPLSAVCLSRGHAKKVVTAKWLIYLNLTPSWLVCPNTQ